MLTSLRTTPETLLQLVRDRWSIECWHWTRHTHFPEDANRYRALNLLRLGCFQSIRTGMQVVMHEIKVLLAMAMHKTGAKT